LKKTFAIVLLVAHFFNLGGYMVLSQYLVYRADKFASEQISKGKYDTANLIEIKIPQHMPQITNWKTYVNVSGQIQFDGAAYNYVKLKVTRDTIFVQCIPNYKTTKLLNENVICAKQLNDIPVSKKAHEASGKKTGIDNKYNHPVITYAFIPRVSAIQKLNTFIFIDINQPIIIIDGRPPEVIA
jgi:hypothetical protein